MTPRIDAAAPVLQDAPNDNRIESPAKKAANVIKLSETSGASMRVPGGSPARR